MTMTEILLTVMCVMCAAAALKCIHDLKDIDIDFDARLRSAEEKIDLLSDHSHVVHGMDSQIFDALDRKIDQQARRITNLGNKHNHLSNVVMEKIQKDWEAEHADI